MARKKATRDISPAEKVGLGSDPRTLEHYNLLLELYEVLAKMGLGRERLRNLSELALMAANIDEVSSSNAEFPESLFDNLVVAGNALYLWNRDKRFLDSHAKPKRLKLHGTSGSVQHLIELCDKTVDSQRVASDMRDVEMVKKIPGGYLPVEYGSPLSPSHPMCKVHFLRSLRSLIWSIENNMVANEGERLIERKALVLQLPVKDFSAFRDLARQQGAALIATMNDWLESKRRHANDTATHGKTSEAGVHFFSFLRKRPKATTRKSRIKKMPDVQVPRKTQSTRASLRRS